jgi:hypothetical protein
MKHLLNNLSEEEKNSIREQHEGGMKLETSRFKTLLENKSGNVKPLVENEEEEDFGFDIHSGDFEGDDSEDEGSEDEGSEEESNEEIFNLIDDECTNLENDDECVTFLNMVIEYCEDKLYEMGQYGGSDEEEDLGFAGHSGDFEGDDSEELDLREFDELEEDDEPW